MARNKIVYLGHYLKYKDKIYSYFWYRTGMRRELAEDLTQEVFLKAWDKYSSFDTDRSFQAWIYSIAHNHLVDHYRLKRYEYDLEAIADKTAEEDFSWELWQILNRLPELDREILSLKYLQGFSYKEIAEMLVKTEEAVRVAAHRAIKRLQAKNLLS